MKAYAVLGSSWGDEGKGVIVDHLCASLGSGLVVRFNGGAQAGHTVTTGDRRHVFHHIGSGTLAGWHTYLGPEFICNPMLYVEESATLPFRRTVHVNINCIVTTPYDMLINRAIEMARSARHGSCGVGINETVERSTRARFRIQVRDLGDWPHVVRLLAIIRREWVPARLTQLGLPEDALDVFLRSGELMNDFAVACGRFLAGVDRVFSQRELLQAQPNLVFEGAQGLALDQGSPDFPYVTRSSTGLTDIIPLCKNADITELEVLYVTRAYFTRHGPGPFPGELDDPPYPGMTDATNIHNEWQGKLRYALLDPEALWKRITADLALAVDTGITVRPRLAVTCVDHVQGPFRYVIEGKEKQASIAQAEIASFISNLHPMGGGDLRPLPPIYSTGPARTDVHQSVAKKKAA